MRHATDSLPPAAPVLPPAAVIDAELRVQGHGSLAAWAFERGSTRDQIVRLLDGAGPDASGLLDELAAALGVVPCCLRPAA